MIDGFLLVVAVALDVVAIVVAREVLHLDRELLARVPLSPGPSRLHVDDRTGSDLPTVYRLPR